MTEIFEDRYNIRFLSGKQTVSNKPSFLISISASCADTFISEFMDIVNFGEDACQYFLNDYDCFAFYNIGDTLHTKYVFGFNECGTAYKTERLLFIEIPIVCGQEKNVVLTVTLILEAIHHLFTKNSKTIHHPYMILASIDLPTNISYLCKGVLYPKYFRSWYQNGEIFASKEVANRLSYALKEVLDTLLLNSTSDHSFQSEASMANDGSFFLKCAIDTESVTLKGSPRSLRINDHFKVIDFESVKTKNSALFLAVVAGIAELCGVP